MAKALISLKPTISFKKLDEDFTKRQEVYNNIVKKYKVVDEKDAFSTLSPSKTMRNKKNSVSIMYSNAPAINDDKYKKYLYQKPFADKASHYSSLPRI